MPSAHQLHPDFGNLQTHSLLHRQSSNLKQALSGSAAAVRKSKEVKRFWLALSASFAIVCRIPAKLYQPRLFRIQGQSKFTHAFLHGCKKSSGIVCFLKSDHTVISVAHDRHFAPCLSASPLLRPEIKCVVQVNVRQQWRDHRALGCALGRPHPTGSQTARDQIMPCDWRHAPYCLLT